MPGIYTFKVKPAYGNSQVRPTVIRRLGRWTLSPPQLEKPVVIISMIHAPSTLHLPFSKLYHPSLTFPSTASVTHQTALVELLCDC